MSTPSWAASSRTAWISRIAASPRFTMAMRRSTRCSPSPMDVVVIGMRTPCRLRACLPFCSRRTAHASVTAGLLTSARTTLVRREPGLLTPARTTLVDARRAASHGCGPVERCANLAGCSWVGSQRSSAAHWSCCGRCRRRSRPWSSHAPQRSRSPACTSAAHVSCSSSSPVRRGRTRPVTGSSPCTPRSRSSCSPPCGRRSSRSGSPRSSGAPGSTRCTRRSPRPARRCSPSASIARMVGGGSR